MDVIAIGKPAINVYLPLQEYPQEGDLFTISTKIESIGNVAATSACLLAKWGENSHFTGVVGNDAYGEKIRETFKNYNVNTRFVEVNYTTNTCVNYITLNVKTGLTTKVLYNDASAQLTKYKYDFAPNYAVIDGTDFAGAIALLNNSVGTTCKTIFYARKADKDTVSMAKKCSYVICTESFATNLTKEECDGSAEKYVNMYQKIVDTSGNSNYIIILNSHKILYAVDGAVKMLPEMKINVQDYSSFDSNFVGAFTYALIHELSLDDAIKFANTTAALSLSKIGEETSIPEFRDVIANSGLKEKFGIKDEVSNGPIKAQEINPLQTHEVVNDTITSENINTNPNVNIENTNSDIQENNVNTSLDNEVKEETNMFDESPTINPETNIENSTTNMFDKKAHDTVMNAFDVSSFNTGSDITFSGNAGTNNNQVNNIPPKEHNIFDTDENV